jgi:hypothetical protein
LPKCWTSSAIPAALARTPAAGHASWRTGAAATGARAQGQRRQCRCRCPGFAAGQLHAAALDGKPDAIRHIAAQIESEMEDLLAFIAAYGKDD